ncbi:Uncharacterized protein HZ326_20646 [Fusarium oxysporum f. sp. albedinis]|nr:Uncharacterized protein HZ326_20646 [Fusarium oxysporum f. sp. albedinis]
MVYGLLTRLSVGFVGVDRIIVTFPCFSVDSGDREKNEYCIRWNVPNLSIVALDQITAAYLRSHSSTDKGVMTEHRKFVAMSGLRFRPSANEG